MKAWLVIPPVVVLFGAACIPGPADPSPPPGALAEGVVELARSSEALDGLVLESLQESASDEISLTLAELDGQAGEVEFFLPAQTMTARLLGLEFLPGPDAWMVAGSMEVAGLDARVGYSLAGGGSGECRLRVNVPLRDIHFQLEASPDTPSLDVGPAEVDGERTGIELEPGCPLADLPVFAEQLAAAVVQAGNLGAQQLAGRVAQALAEHVIHLPDGDVRRFRVPRKRAGKGKDQVTSEDGPNRYGYRPPYKDFVRYLLNRPFYAGYVTYAHEPPAGAGKQKPIIEENEGAHPAIISRQLFDEVQRIRKSVGTNSRRRGAVRRVDLPDRLCHVDTLAPCQKPYRARIVLFENFDDPFGCFGIHAGADLMRIAVVPVFNQRHQTPG